MPKKAPSPAEIARATIPGGKRGSAGAKTSKTAAHDVNAPHDLALLAGPTADGEGAHLLRLKDGQLTAGELRPAREGQPLHDGELVRLKPIHPRSPLCAVETLYAPSDRPDRPDRPEQRGQVRQGVAQGGERGGPARVANDSYRKNWTSIFGAQPKKRSRRVPDDWSVN